MYEFQLKKMRQVRKGMDWNKTFDEVQIGDYFVVSGGYGMILVTFYRVIDKRGKATLEVIRVGNRFVSGDHAGGEVVPDEGKVEGGPYRVRCTSGHGVGVAFLDPEYGWTGQHAYPWDGRPMGYNDMD